VSEAERSLGSQLVTRRFAQSVIGRTVPKSVMYLHRWRPRWIQESRALFRARQRPLGLISLSPLLPLSGGRVRERASYYQGSLVLAGTTTPLDEGEVSGGAASQTPFPFSVSEVRRALERKSPTPTSATTPRRAAQASRRGIAGVRQRNIQRAAGRGRSPVSPPAGVPRRNLVRVAGKGPLPRPVIQEIGLSSPEGVPPIVLPEREPEQETVEVAGGAGLEQIPEGLSSARPSEAVSAPPEVRRQAAGRPAAGQPSPDERLEEAVPTVAEPVEGATPKEAVPVRAQQAGRQAEAAARPERRPEGQVRPRPALAARQPSVARRVSASQEAPAEKRREVQPETEIPQVPATEPIQGMEASQVSATAEVPSRPEGEQVVQRVGDLAAGPEMVPVSQAGPETQESEPVARPSSIEPAEEAPIHRSLEEEGVRPTAAEPVGPRVAPSRGVQRVPASESARRATPIIPSGVTTGPVAVAGSEVGRTERLEALGPATREAREPEVDLVQTLPEATGVAELEPRYTALGPEYEELGLGLGQSSVTPERRDVGPLPPSAIGREVPAEAQVGDAERARGVRSVPLAPSASQGLPRVPAERGMPVVRPLRVSDEEIEATAGEPEHVQRVAEPQPPVSPFEAATDEEAQMARPLRESDEGLESPAGEPEHVQRAAEPQPSTSPFEEATDKEAQKAQPLRVPGEEVEGPADGPELVPPSERVEPSASVRDLEGGKLPPAGPPAKGLDGSSEAGLLRRQAGTAYSQQDSEELTPAISRTVQPQIHLRAWRASPPSRRRQRGGRWGMLLMLRGQLALPLRPKGQ